MNVLGIFAKRPEPGRSKTRLASSIGNRAAAELYAAFVEDLLQHVGNRSEQRVVAVTPNSTVTQEWFGSRLPDTCQLCFQPDGDLGERIQWFFDAAFADGATRVVLMGSDSPDLPDSLIDEAFDRLSKADAVLAPAADGGCVLIGLSRIPPALFRNLPWSAATTLTAMMARFAEHKQTVELLSPWYDVDTVDNLGTLRALQQSSTSPAHPCPKTRAALESLWPKICGAIET